MDNPAAVLWNRVISQISVNKPDNGFQKPSNVIEVALCADSSDQWLRLFAANLSEDDVEDIRALTSVPAIDRCKVTRQAGDSATVVCELSHVFLLDTIGSRDWAQ